MKVRPRFKISLKKNRAGEYYIVLTSTNGRKFNHKYNTKAKAKQSADSLARSMKLGHCKKDY